VINGLSFTDAAYLSYGGTGIMFTSALGQLLPLTEWRSASGQGLKAGSHTTSTEDGVGWAFLTLICKT
jgi:hypothetical protein